MGLPFAFIKSVEFVTEGKVIKKVPFSGGKPFQCQLGYKAEKVVVRLEFHAHYGEPPLDIPINITAGIGGWSLIVDQPHPSRFNKINVCVQL